MSIFIQMSQKWLGQLTSKVKLQKSGTAMPEIKEGRSWGRSCLLALCGRQ
jgi:hypothetical protein